MPGWHEATKALQQQGKLQMVGIIEEQHPERCRLFMQWKQMDWPILVDPLNLLAVDAVPITLAVDEYGIVRQKGLPLEAAENIEQTFLSQTFSPPDASVPASPATAAAPNLDDLAAASRGGKVENQLRYADALVMWAKPERLDEAIAAYQQVLKKHPGYGPAHFRLGVALRRRYESAQRRPGDFQLAVEQWKEALDLNPNQYIWRRRIQQYGPRLDKPYPFYDWVPAARREIEARGETPTKLRVEPGGAEFAAPAKSFDASESLRKEPDPSARIHRDDGRFVEVEATSVPPVLEPGEAARVHLVFRPNLSNRAHWNNEVDGLEVWVNPPQGWQVDERLLSLPNPPEAVSQETRRLEFEVRCPPDADAGPATLSSYGLYYVCEDVNGTCLYRRQDISIPIEVRREAF